MCVCVCVLCLCVCACSCLCCADLFARSYFTDLWQIGHQVRRCRLELARLYLKLCDYRKCRQMCMKLMALPSSDDDEQDNVREIEALHDEAEARVRREGKIGLATVAAIVVLFGALAHWSLRPSSPPPAAAAAEKE